MKDLNDGVCAAVSQAWSEPLEGARGGDVSFILNGHEPINSIAMIWLSQDLGDHGITIRKLVSRNADFLEHGKV